MATIVQNPNAIIPFAGDDMFILQGELEYLFPQEYFIAARTLNGARFYSENFEEKDLNYYISLYKAMVDYFGGGRVLVYNITDDSAIIVDDIVCWG